MEWNSIVKAEIASQRGLVVRLFNQNSDAGVNIPRVGIIAHCYGIKIGHAEINDVWHSLR